MAGHRYIGKDSVIFRMRHAGRQLNCKTMLNDTILFKTVQGGFAVIIGAFLRDTLEHMIPWLMASTAVILCDLVFGVRKALLMGEEVRLSHAVRATMGKTVTYFSFVFMVCAITVATDTDWHIDVYSCLLVCLIEGCSILDNLLKPKGYGFNLGKALGLLVGKLFKVAKEDAESVVTKKGEKG